MKRRDFIRALGAGTVAATGLAACNRNPDNSGDQPTAADTAVREWRMVTTWPKNYPGLGTGANLLADLITRMSGGRIKVKVYGSGELVNALEVFDAVANGTAQIAHGAAYYWKGKVPSAQFFAAMPFGMNAQEMNAWLYYGGGMALWREAYAPFGIVPAAAGNTGVQMGGWFNREIKSVNDLKDLKMRIPGLGAEVMSRVGAQPVILPGGEIFTAMETGVIDATEWVGPYNDLAFGLHNVAKYYYYPGWQEPGSVLEALINQQAFDELPEDLQAIVTNACKAVNVDMLSEYTARNQAALTTLVEEHGVQLKRFPDDVLRALKQAADEVLDDIAANDALAARVLQSARNFRRQVRAWHKVSEQAFFAARDL